MRRRLAAVGIALAIAALASGVVLAASRTIADSGVFYACYNAAGNVKLINHKKTTKCPKGWMGPVSWNQSGHIGIKNVYYIGKDYDVSGNQTILRVWMKTGSPSEACLATMGEANHAPSVDTIYCSSRLVTLADGKQHWGVALTLMLAGPLEDDPSQADPSMIPAWYSLNVYQEGARSYGAPTRCDLPGC